MDLIQNISVSMHFSIFLVYQDIAGLSTRTYSFVRQNMQNAFVSPVTVRCFVNVSDALLKYGKMWSETIFSKIEMSL